MIKTFHGANQAFPAVEIAIKVAVALALGLLLGFETEIADEGARPFIGFTGVGGIAILLL